MRIIAGKYKGKKLNNFNYNDIRPTSDFVKEAVFNKIQFLVNDCVFLDLFGGTGAIGFEALSRGAKTVYICDNNKNSIQLINKNKSFFNDFDTILQNKGKQNDKSNIINVIFADYEKALISFAKQKISFDIIFIDPPYATDAGIKAIHLIAKLKLLNKEGVIVFEHHKKDSFEFGKDITVKEKRIYGIKMVEYINVGEGK